MAPACGRTTILAACWLATLCAAEAPPRLRVDLGPTHGGIREITLADRKLFYDVGLHVRTADGLVHQDRYNAMHFRDVVVKHDGDDRLVVGEVKGLLTFFQRVSVRADHVAIDCEVTTQRELTAALGLRGGIALEPPCSRTVCFANGAEQRFPDEPGQAAGLSGTERIGWRCDDGFSVEITPLDDTVRTMNIQDLRQHGGPSFVFRCFARATGWQPRKIEPGQVIRFGVRVSCRASPTPPPDPAE